jgi:hypothetical protein
MLTHMSDSASPESNVGRRLDRRMQVCALMTELAERIDRPTPGEGAFARRLRQNRAGHAAPQQSPLRMLRTDRVKQNDRRERVKVIAPCVPSTTRATARWFCLGRRRDLSTSPCEPGRGMTLSLLHTQGDRFLLWFLQNVSALNLNVQRFFD